MHRLTSNVRYAIRQFQSSPVFTAAAIVTLALGIGGTTAIFTLMDAIMLRSLPVADPGRLYRIGDSDICCETGAPQNRWGMFSYALYQRLKTETPEFADVAAFQASGAHLSVRRQNVELAPRPLRSEYVTGNYFSVLGVPAFGGRVFTPDDDRAGAPPVAVLSHQAWQTAYGGAPSVVGSTFVVEGHPFTVIGVAPPGFFGETLRGNPTQIWIPLQQSRLLTRAQLLDQPPAAWLRLIGRLKPGASVAGMGPRLTGVLRQFIKNEPTYPPGWKVPQVINVVPAGAGVAEMKDAYGRSLRILITVCGLVLLIACANVANLLLARAAARRAQTAVCLAIGASGRQIVAQALTESVLLAAGGGIAGVAVSIAAARLLLALAFHNVRFLPISPVPSLTVLGFAFALALLTGVIFGAAPAWFATRTGPAEALRGAGRVTGRHASFASNALLVVQATLSVVLVAGATMLARSLTNLEHKDFGYPLQGRVLVEVQNPPAGYTQTRLTTLYRQLEERLNRLPGVRGSGLALYNALTNNWSEYVRISGHPAPRFDQDASWDRVSAAYLQNLGVRVLRGRLFTPADNETTAPVAVVNQAFVKEFLRPGEDPLGQHFGMDLPENAGTFRIVGVVADAKFAIWAVRQPSPATFFLPLAQHVSYKSGPMSQFEDVSHFIEGILLVTNQAPGALEPVLTKALAEVDPNLTIVSVQSLAQVVESRFNQERAVASLAGLFGIVALLLAVVGLYGVTAYAVARRTNEIGIRMALGADRAKVVQLVLRGASNRVLAGLLLGVPLAIGAGQLIAAELYGVASWDPVALLVAAGALAICAFFAALIPARRAASISPVEALRTE